MESNPKTPGNNEQATILAYIITAVWAVSFIVDIFLTSYDPPASVHILMMATAGYVFREGIIKVKNGNGLGKKEDQDG